MEERLPLPNIFELLLEMNDQDHWPTEATLLIAAYDGNVRRLKEIARGLDVNGRGVDSVLRCTTFKGMDALHAAAGGKGKLPICRYLVEEAKMDVNRHDTVKGKSMTPLQHAVFSGSLPIVRFLLDHGADVHQEGSHERCTALHTVAHKGRCEIAKLLLSRGAYVDGKSCHMTPLQLAVHGGHDSTVKILLDHNADCDRFPIELAAVYGTREDVEILFPCTSPIPTVTNWSIDGIINHMELERKQREDDDFVEAREADLKRQGGDALKKQDYINSSAFYTQEDDFVEARKSDLKRQGGDALKKQDYINSSAFYTQAAGTRKSKHASTIGAQMVFILAVLSLAYIPSATAATTITTKAELCDTRAIAAHIMRSCPMFSNPKEIQCCDQLVWAVDEEGGGRCLCGAVEEMAKVGEARTYNDVARLYLDCGGFNAELIHRHVCHGNTSDWMATATVPKPKAEVTWAQGQPWASSPVPMNIWKEIAEAFYAALIPTLLYISFHIGLICAKWVMRAYNWLYAHICPMTGCFGGNVELKEIVIEGTTIEHEEEVYGTPCSDLVQGAVLDRLLPTVQNAKQE